MAVSDVKLDPAPIRCGACGDPEAVPDDALRHNGRDDVENVPPALFSRTFMEIVGLAVGDGLVSVRRAAALLDLSVDDLSDLFAFHGVARPADL